MRAHSDARSKSKYLAHFPVQGDFRAPGMDVTTRMPKKKKKKNIELLHMQSSDKVPQSKLKH